MESKKLLIIDPNRKKTRDEIFMVQCAYCQKELGFFGKASKKVDEMKVYFCPTCVGKWELRRLKQRVAYLCANGPPKELFMLTRTAYRDPEDFNILLRGPLLFADKAVCFFQISLDKNPNNIWSPTWWGSSGASTVSPLLALFDNSLRPGQKADQAVQSCGQNFEALSIRAYQLFVIPRETIKDIVFRGGKLTTYTLEIKAEKNHIFNLFPDSKEPLERFKSEIVKYLKHQL
jgi:hypothetical protein